MSLQRLSFTAFAAVVLHSVAVSVAAAQSTPQLADSLARGRAIFEATCRSCHTIAPPPQGGPPMSRIAQRYLAVTGSRAAGATRIADWLTGPAVAKSLLPRDEVARFGLMPHQPLANAGRFAVAAYVMTLADSAPRPRRQRP